ncbi:MAG: aminomethyl-transferring glycine dehydrogenase [Cellvibrionaceae bacterium]|nr:aminomethyl-transferring glycine dehydrogenase [Cellvibrionaceae bacterium]
MSDFQHRHIGPRQADIDTMLNHLGYSSLDALSEAVVPKAIADNTPLKIPAAVSEEQALAELRALAQQNQVLTSLIGQGYYNTYTPKVIQRNLLENPAWYTAYTPYQPEISQGRLEVLFYFQTLISELTAMDIANASLLDEATAAAEAMSLCYQAARGKKRRFLVSTYCHPQTLALLQTRAAPLGIELVSFDETRPLDDWHEVFGLIVQYPSSYGDIYALKQLSDKAHDHKALVVMATDLLALTLLTPPGQLGADVVVGSSQRFGVPMGFGGPHAGFISTRDRYKRLLPGRLIGQSLDAQGQTAYRLALQTREQHIRREKATSNICTAQALLAMMATLYACYHGPAGLKAIAQRVHGLCSTLADALQAGGVKLLNTTFFDTLHIAVDDSRALLLQAQASGYNLNQRETTITLSLDETSTLEDVKTILSWFNITSDALDLQACRLQQTQLRQDNYLSQPVFHQYHSETDMMRYLRYLADKDIALDRAMIPLGSCTMKLNAASEMTPISWPEFANIHPFAPAEQSRGYQQMIQQLETMLAAATGYDAISLQPNAGSQGEYAGLLAIKAYHKACGHADKDICLIPTSAHGTNPASAQMTHMQVVTVKCDSAGNVDIDDLDAKIAQYPKRIAAIMLTYPSTHGVFEERVSEICERVHQAGGQVYIDGANLNALIGLAQPGRFGGDVSHLNLHKTFCIPHGGGGPGVGPIGVGKQLIPFLPKDSINPERRGAQVSAAPFGSAAILPISWMYMRMMGAEGLRRATQVAILNANYIAWRLNDKYPILYTGNQGLVAHECIIDTRPMKQYGISVDDIAKRLIDFGFHAPTMSFPVAGTLMIEPTESESLAEIERFCRAMAIIHAEYMQVKTGQLPADNNPLVNAPHTAAFLLADTLNIPYSRQQACYPDEQHNKSQKYWPPVARIDNVYGDKNLICTCPTMENYASQPPPS